MTRVITARSASAVAAFAVAVSIIIIVLEYPLPSSGTPASLQNTPSAFLTDNQIISQTDKTVAVKDFMAIYGHATARVVRGSVVSAPITGNEIEVLYRNSGYGQANGSVILHVLLSKQETFAQDANEMHVIYECNSVYSVLPCGR